MNRHTFIKNTSLAGAAALIFGIADPVVSSARSQKKEKPFNMKFSPEFGIFKEVVGKDVIDQIKWGYDQGFRSWENTRLKSRPVQEQESISKTIQQLGMEFGQFVGTMNFKEVSIITKEALEKYKKEYSQYWNAILSGTGEITLEETTSDLNEISYED